LTQSGGASGEYSLGTATLTMRGDMVPLERDLARMREVIAEMERRGAKIPASFPKPPPPPPPETQRGYEGLLKTVEALRRGVQGDGEAFTMLSKQLRGAGEAAGAAGGSGGFGGASSSLAGMLGMAGKAVPMLAQVGLAAAGLQAIFGGLKGAVSGVLAPLEQLSAEAGRLNKQVAEAGIFAAQSFSIFGPDGKIVEGTARQMQMVRGAILKEYQGIQKEVANISGATAAEIYEGFNIILQNISALGEKGTLENSARLATRIAAGMNTLGIPGFQLRQEVNALMTGNIDRNATMAMKLGISPDDVKREQSAGTYNDFLMKKLEKLYDGQKVLSASMANVLSNFEESNQAISATAGQPLERDTAQMLSSIQVTFKNLQGSFSGFFKSIAEAVGPIIKLLGPVGSALTSIGAIASSVGRVIMDVFGLATAALANDLLPILTFVVRSLELVGRTVQLIAEGIGALINPLKAMLNVESDTDNAGVSTFFDEIFKGFEKASSAIEAFNQKWSKMVLNTSLATLRGRMKLQGKSDEEIATAENDMRERFKIQSGLTEPVELRSLKLPPNITNYLDELNTRLGSGATRALNISKAWADIKVKAYQNEIKALEQGLNLMNKQREVAEAMSAVGAARRALVARGYELGVQVAGSPEARFAAEARLADLKLRQEREGIAERRGILQTERELQQRQMMIQEKQIKIQQEQLKIQVAEARAEQVREAEATKAALQARANTAPLSPEWMGFTRELNVLAAERTRNAARVSGAQQALRLAFEAEGQLGTINGLEAQRLGLQEQQLDIQGQSATYTRQQQALLAQISQEEQKITNDLTRATNEQNRKKQALESQSEEINRQNTLLDRQSRLQKAQEDLAVTRAKAEVQTAQRLVELQELQDRARNGGGTASVIEAQIAAAAAGVSGMETAAQVQERLYQAREQQMTREHELQQRQMQFQHEREASEVRIQRLQMESQRVAIALQRAQATAEIARLTLQQRRDAISPQLAGATSVPGLGLGGVARLPGSISGRLDASGQNGADMPVGPNNEMRSYHNGVVTEINRAGNNGNYAVIKFVDDLGNKLEATYSHMAAIVKVGQQVVGGQVLGRFDGSGRAFGAHNSVDINSPGTNGALQRNAETAAARRSADLLVAGRVQGQGGSSVGTSPTPILSAASATANPKLQRIMQAARGAGFQGEDLIRMTAVAMAESGGDLRALNNNPGTGDLSYGAWQVNMRGQMGPDRRRQFGLASNEALFDLNTNARVARSIFDSQGITAWGAFTDGRFQQYMGQARAAAARPAVMDVGRAVSAAGGTVAPSTVNQAQGLQQNLQDLRAQETRLDSLIQDLQQWQSELGNIFSLQQENLTEQQLAESEQFEVERRKSLLTAQVMKTPEGRLGVAASDAVSGSISGSLSGALQALLSGGDVRQAVSGALAQAGQTLLQATLDSLLNPLLAQLQGGIVKAVTGIDIEGQAQQVAAASLQGAAGAQQGAAVQLSSAAQALMAAAGVYGPGAVSSGVGVLGSLAAKLPSLIGGFAGLGSFIPPAGAFSGASALVDFAAAPNLVSGVGRFTPPIGAFTPGLAGGGEVEYGLDYLVGEKNAEIVRFNQAGGKVFSNRALTKALGVPFQRAPGGGTEVAEGGGDLPGVPFLGAGPARAARGSRSAPGGIPFLKASTSGPAPGGPAGSAQGAAMARSSALRLTVDTQVINGVEYATVDQLREAATASAQASRESVYYDLSNNPSIQRQVGWHG
jgi:murein DD-endopeptidase MepM/ murein hydrolase activator NlpD